MSSCLVFLERVLFDSLSFDVLHDSIKVSSKHVLIVCKYLCDNLALTTIELNDTKLAKVKLIFVDFQMSFIFQKILYAWPFIKYFIFSTHLINLLLLLCISSVCWLRLLSLKCNRNFYGTIHYHFCSITLHKKPNETNIKLSISK